jgi:hypothetical protein
MTNIAWTYIDPLAMRNIEGERRELGLEPLQRRVSRSASNDRNTIHWWVLKYEAAGRALVLDANR